MTANTDLTQVNFVGAKILVVGDVMLDQYWHGGTSRISPEAPVPVVKIKKTDNRPGGAANVAANLIALGVQTKLLGAVGNDSAGEILRNLLQARDIPHNLVTLNRFSTILKLRVICRQQQMIRLDHEDELEDILSLEDLKNIYDIFAGEISNYQAVILSDYAKGVLSNPRPYIEVANAFNIPVIVDPKSNDFSLYQGAYIVKPNLSEFENIVGKCSSLAVLEERARNLLAACNINTLVITRGAEGISVVSNAGSATHLPAISGEVYDVTGAGDTVIAVLAAAVAAKVDIVKAAHMSTIAAGLVVAKVGTSSVTMQEIKQSIGKTKELPLGVMPEELLRDVIRQCQSRGEKVVFVNGCYDLIHYGHIRYLERARALGDRLVIGVNTDESVKRLKGPTRPMYNLEQRMQVLASLRAVDWVVPFAEDTPGRLVESLNPNVLVKGDEHFKSIEQIPASEGTEHVLKNGGEVHLIGRTVGVSSSKMIEFFGQEQ